MAWLWGLGGVVLFCFPFPILSFFLLQLMPSNPSATVQPLSASEPYSEPSYPGAIPGGKTLVDGLALGFGGLGGIRGGVLFYLPLPFFLSFFLPLVRITLHAIVCFHYSFLSPHTPPPFF